jgi:uncharacterized membrane protein
VTEQQWASCADPNAMLEFLESRASERKLRLFAVACCRRVGPLMTDTRHQAAVEAAERFAAGLLSEEEFELALQPVVALWADIPNASRGEWASFHYLTAATRHLEREGGAPYAASFASGALACLSGLRESPAWVAATRSEEAAQCDLIRDLFGNPAVPFHFPLNWRSGPGSVVVERAREVYREGRFEAITSLADVLERAGCRDQAVLEHCRGPGGHIRGCWVLDALLGHETAVHTGLIADADWQACDNPEPLLYFLRDKGTDRQWRLFAVACCRRIGHLITDARSKRAIDVAERYAEGTVTEEELEAARIAAQQAQDEAKRAEYDTEAEEDFGYTPVYAAALCRLVAAAAARSAVCRDPRTTDAEPGTFEAERWAPSNRLAAAAVGTNVFANFKGEQEATRREDARPTVEAAEAVELCVQCQILRDLFQEHLGPVGKEGGWLPSEPPGVPRRHAQEHWCLLPTPRNFSLRPEWLTWNDGTVLRLAQAIYDEQAFDRLPILADALVEAGCTLHDLLEHLRGPGPHWRGCSALDAILRRE